MKHTIICPKCGSTMIEFIKSGKNFEDYKCLSCNTIIRRLNLTNGCPNCRSEKVCLYYNDGIGCIYCMTCGSILTQKIIIDDDMRKERLRFKTPIPKDYLTDIMIDLYKLGKEEQNGNKNN